MMTGRDIDRLKMMATNRVQEGGSAPRYRHQDATGCEANVSRQEFFTTLAQQLSENGPMNVQIQDSGRTFFARTASSQPLAKAPLQEAA